MIISKGGDLRPPLWRFKTDAEALEYGIVRINEGTISTEIAPLGGMEESGIRRKEKNTASRNCSKANISVWGRIDR
jgi:acyl-CoA reductase-like NAD-dependent aldehyde dehydrogenase